MFLLPSLTKYKFYLKCFYTFSLNKESIKKDCNENRNVVQVAVGDVGAASKTTFNI